MTAERCPLCRATERRPIWRIEYKRIWKALREEYGAVFSPEVIQRHTGDDSATLNACGRCGLHYFAPQVAGDAEFYRELMSGAAYEAERWEFGFVARSVGASNAVLDIGCGEGAFLRKVAPRVRRAAGVDHNEPAIRRLREAGIEAHAEDAASFASREQEAFDVVIAFHTLEHLADVGIVVEPAVACTKPGGRIFISVPNRDRYGRPDFEVLDCPPHHLSRWHPDQFGMLARHFGLTLLTLRFEEPDSSHAALWQIDRARTLGERFAGARGGTVLARAYTRIWLSRPALPKKRYAFAAARKRFTRRGVYGMTMLAEFRKPPVDVRR